MATESAAVPITRRGLPPVSKLIIAGLIGLFIGFAAAVGLARTFDSELFHPSGAIIKTDTQITRIYIPEGNAGVIYTDNDIPLTTWTTEAWDGDFLNEVLDQAGCQLSQPCSAAIGIPASVTYANPKEGLVYILHIEAL
jgi:hypothetical protein